MSLEIANNPTPDPAAARKHKPAPNKHGSVGQRAKRGAYLVVFGMVFSQFMRLASNLLLTRLLMPEAFGLMAMVNIFVSGINMFSDLGIRPSIVQNKLGDDPRFLNTAWTMQVMRGFGIWLVACLIAYPVALVYDMPELAWLLPVAAFGSVLLGFQSTKLYTAGRHLFVGRETLLDLICGIIGLLSMAVLAYIRRDVWSLVIGGLIGTALKTVLSHYFFPGPNNRFAWDRECLGELIRFGKWIFLSTIALFLANNADRLILGKLIVPALLGVYNIAFMISSLPQMMLKRLGSKIIFPVLSRKLDDTDREKLWNKMLKQQRRVAFFMAIPVLALAVAGDWIIRLGWTEPYHQAGWMLSLMSIGIWIAVLRTSVGPALLAVGKPQFTTYSQLGRIVWMGIASFAGYYIGAGFDPEGQPPVYALFGFLVAYSLAELPGYIITSFGRASEKLFTFTQDAWMTALFVLALGALVGGRYMMGWGVPFMPPDNAAQAFHELEVQYEAKRNKETNKD